MSASEYGFVAIPVDFSHSALGLFVLGTGLTGQSGPQYALAALLKPRFESAILLILGRFGSRCPP